MSYTSRVASYKNALRIAGSAMDSSRRRVRLCRCRALLRELDPDKPPANAHAREFQRQYRALQERVALYSEHVEASDNPDKSNDYGLHKSERAVVLSLRYFRNVLPSACQPILVEDTENVD